MSEYPQPYTWKILSAAGTGADALRAEVPKDVLCVFEVLEELEVMRYVLLRMLEAVKGCWRSWR